MLQCELEGDVPKKMTTISIYTAFLKGSGNQILPNEEDIISLELCEMWALIPNSPLAFRVTLGKSFHLSTSSSCIYKMERMTDLRCEVLKLYTTSSYCLEKACVSALLHCSSH